MIKQYRKKPVVIEAMQFEENLTSYMKSYRDLQSFLGDALTDVDIDPTNHDHVYRLYIKTPHGRMRVSPGDFIIRDIKGEFYPCEPDVFEATYEEAASPEHFKACPYSWDGLICEVSSRFAQERDIAQADSATLRQQLAEQNNAQIRAEREVPRYCSVCARILDDAGVCPMTKAPEHLKTCPYSRDGLNCEILTRFAAEIDVVKTENASLRKHLAEAKEKIKKLEHKTCASCRYEGDPDKCMELQCFGGAWTPKEVENA